MAEYLIRISAQLVITSQLLRLDSKLLFADLNFAFTINAYITVLVASTFNSIVNVELSKDARSATRFYSDSLNFKIVMHAVLLVLLPLLLHLPLGWVTIIAATGFVSTIVEHQDVALRFHETYSPYFFRCLTAVAFAALKCLAIHFLEIELFLLCSLAEVISILLINKKYVDIKRTKGSIVKFFLQNKSVLLRSFTSNSLIFTFFRLDQLFVYTQIGRTEYAIYAFGARINESLNGITGILSRRQIPQILQNRAKYSHSLVELSIAHSLCAGALYFAALIYVHLVAPAYEHSPAIFVVLAVSGIFLIFGQLRGTYFVAQGYIMADAINALIGISVLLIGFQIINDLKAIQVAIVYGIGFFASGVASCFLYRTGRHYLSLVIKGAI